MISDLTGQKFGRLTVLRKDSKPHPRHLVSWICLCDCGSECSILGTRMLRGFTKSCGCYRKQHSSELRKKNPIKSRHGHARAGRISPTYKSWYAMIQRCENPKNVRFARYGARGIVVCAAWSSFDQFLQDMGERPEGKTLDRINPDGNYEPANCRWATPKEQANNKSRKATSHEFHSI